MGFGETEFPRKTGMRDGGLRRSAGATVVSGNQNNVRVCLGDAGGDGADADFGDELYADARMAVGVLEIVDELREIFDGVDIVVRRGRDEADAGGGAAGLGNRRIYFRAGQLAAFAGLRTLGHLDLDFFRAREVFRRDAETSGGDLFDRGVFRIAVGHRDETRGIFAAFPGVGATADAVHGDRKRLVRLGGDGAVGHGSRLEALHDDFDGLDLLERDRGGGLELEQAAQGAEFRTLIVDDLRVVFEGGVTRRAHGLLEAVDRLGREEVSFTLAAPLVLSAGGQHGRVGRALGIGGAMAGEDFLRDDIEADAADARGGPREVVVDDGLVETEGFEHLGAAVTLDRGDAHLGHDLDDALGRSFHQVLARGLVIDAGEQRFPDHVIDRLERHVGIDRGGAVADEQRKVVHFARVTSLDDDGDAGAETFADEIVVQAGDGEQRRHGCEFLRHAAVGEDEDVGLVFLDVAAGHHAQFFHRLREALLAAGDAEEDGQHGGLETRQIGAADLGELLVGENRILQLHATAGGRLRVEEIAFGTETGLGGSDDFFANGVDRGIGDLRKELFEVIVEQARLIGEHGERRVVAHRADGFDAILGHRHENDALVFVGVAEGDLALEQRDVVGLVVLRCLGQVAEVHEMLVEPLAVGTGVADLVLEFFVGDDPALRSVHEKHLAGLDAAFFDDLFGGNRQHAGLGSDDDKTVLGDVVTRRAQAVAVEDAADLDAVGERDRGGAVPRLHQAGVILVKRAAVVGHGLMVGPRLGDHHHHGVRERAAGEDEELERIVEHRRIGAVRVNDRQDLLDVVAEGRAVEERLAGVHPIDVAAEGVDFAIVGDVAVRMRALPAGKRVRRETRVDDREGGLHRGVDEVGKILRDLLGEEHAFVDERLHREARDIPRFGSGDRGGADVVIGALADHVELPLEIEIGGDVCSAADEDLAHERLAGDGGVAEGLVIRRHRAPAEEELPFGLDDLLEDFFHLAADGAVPREIDETGAVLAGFGERDARGLGNFGEKFVRHLDEDARAVTSIGLAASGTTVVEVGENLECVGDDFVRFPSLHIDNEADPAGIVFERGIVEALFSRGTSGRSLGRVEGVGGGGGVDIHGLEKRVRVSVVVVIVGVGGLVPDAHKKGRLVLCESGPVCVMCGELSVWSKKADRFSGHFSVLLIGAARIGGRAGGGIAGFHEIVAEQIIFDFLARNVGEHDAVDLDTRGKGLTGLLHHLGVIRAVVDDIDVLERQIMLPHNRADTIGPATGGLEVGFDDHVVSVCVDSSGAR